jgi:Rps23 Pro-64 3,4-dihydroxylase Tpa1-like proline 4-hydroxylase
MKYINDQDWGSINQQFLQGKPFNFVAIDNFFTPDVAQQLVKDFPNYSSDVWHTYNNAIEDKKTCNNWNQFPKTTYSVFNYLGGIEFMNVMSQIVGVDNLSSDPGLNGGGWHAHAKNGKLNVHLDYSIHPKLGLKRNFNLIIYMTPNWEASWGGGLELWSHDDATNQPKEKVGLVENKFNRAVIFDTTQNSWHGLPADLKCPEGTARQSLAVYYLTPADSSTDPRGKALFAPYQDQANDPDVLNLIKKRSNILTASEVYKK